MVASTNDHVDAINAAVQAARLAAGDLDPTPPSPIAGGERAHVGDVVATRRNDRRLTTSGGEPVRNRETVDRHRHPRRRIAHRDPQRRTRHVTLPADYVREHVRLGYAATEHGNQSDTVTIGIDLASRGDHPSRPVRRGHPRPRREPDLVVTDSADVADEARDILDASSPSTVPTSPPSPNAAGSPSSTT